MKAMLLTSLCCVMLAVFTGSISAVTYEAVDLGSGDVRGINDQGQILLQEYNTYSVWENGTKTYIYTASPPFSYNNRVTPIGIYDNGYLGGRVSYQGRLTTCIWKGTDISYIYYSDGTRYYGEFRRMSGNCHYAFGGCNNIYVWNDGELYFLDAPTGATIGANGINNNGQVVGTWRTEATGTTGCIWDGSTRYDLAKVSKYDVAYAINDVGQVVGYAQYGDLGYYTHACIWENGQVRELGTYQDDGDSWAYGINNRGQVIGQTFANGYGSSRAILWDNGQAINLGALGGANLHAYTLYINNSGWVVGSSVAADGRMHATLWRPVPEPASVIALLAGFAGLGYSVLKRK